MPAAKKIEQVKALEKYLGGATLVIGTNYAKLTVADMEALRRALRKGGAQYRVVKNSLALRAADQIGQRNLGKVLQGPTGLIVTRGDPVQSVRTLSTYLKTSRLNLPVTGAVLDGQALTPAQVDTLASMPSREVLLSQLLGDMQGVLRGLVTVLNAHLIGLVTVLEQRRRQLEEGSKS